MVNEISDVHTKLAKPTYHQAALISVSVVDEWGWEDDTTTHNTNPLHNSSFLMDQYAQGLHQGQDNNNYNVISWSRRCTKNIISDIKLLLCLNTTFWSWTFRDKRATLYSSVNSYFFLVLMNTLISLCWVLIVGANDIVSRLVAAE